MERLWTELWPAAVAAGAAATLDVVSQVLLATVSSPSTEAAVALAWLARLLPSHAAADEAAARGRALALVGQLAATAALPPPTEPRAAQVWDALARVTVDAALAEDAALRHAALTSAGPGLLAWDAAHGRHRRTSFLAVCGEPALAPARHVFLSRPSPAGRGACRVQDLWRRAKAVAQQAPPPRPPPSLVMGALCRAIDWLLDVDASGATAGAAFAGVDLAHDDYFAELLQVRPPPAPLTRDAFRG